MTNNIFIVIRLPKYLPTDQQIDGLKYRTTGRRAEGSHVFPRAPHTNIMIYIVPFFNSHGEFGEHI